MTLLYSSAEFRQNIQDNKELLQNLVDIIDQIMKRNQAPSQIFNILQYICLKNKDIPAILDLQEAQILNI